MATFLAKITNKELDFGSPTNQARFNDFKTENEGKYIKITKPKENRTLSQNNLYWLYLEVIGRETGNDAEELHELFKQKFLPRKTVIVQGKKSAHEVVMIKSTTKLSKVEFGDYMDKICSLTDVPVPDKSLAGFLED